MRSAGRYYSSWEHSRSGKIKGERFARHIVTDFAGKVIKDHWDNKRKT